MFTCRQEQHKAELGFPGSSHIDRCTEFSKHTVVELLLSEGISARNRLPHAGSTSQSTSPNYQFIVQLLNVILFFFVETVSGTNKQFCSPAMLSHRDLHANQVPTFHTMRSVTPTGSRAYVIVFWETSFYHFIHLIPLMFQITTVG